MTNMDKEKAIILSGGWGYGNLGDDALLMASVKLIRHFFGHKPIIVLSYDAKSSEEIVPTDNRLSYAISMHNMLFESRRKKLNIAYSLGGRVRIAIEDSVGRYKERQRNRTMAAEVLRSQSKFINDNLSSTEYFADLCEESDMYIMSGGGYINTWGEMLVSKFMEISIAKQHGLKTFAIGQTIGPWTNSKESEKLGRLLFSLSDGSFFRDIDSVNDMHRWKLPCTDTIVPDLALSDTFLFTKKQQMAFIPFGYHTNEIVENISCNLMRISQKYGYEIVITASQLWEGSVKACVDYFIELKKRHANVRIKIPNNVIELQKTLGESKLCVSGNLHGLILAYRASAPVVSINDGRKFKSFMQMIGAGQAIVPPQSVSEDNIYNLAVTVMSSLQFKDFRDMIYKHFHDMIVCQLGNNSLQLPPRKCLCSWNTVTYNCQRKAALNQRNA